MLRFGASRVRLFCCALLGVIWAAVTGPVACKASRMGYTTKAIELANAGRLDEAATWFKKHTVDFPEDDQGWGNWGVTQLRQASRLGGERGRSILLDAAESFRRSLALSVSQPSIDNFNSVRQSLSDLYQQELPDFFNDPLANSFPSEFCDPSAPPCGWSGMQLSTEQLASKIKQECSDVAFKITKLERKTGRIALETLLGARQALRTCGVVQLDRLFRKVRTARIRAAFSHESSEFVRIINTD